MYIYMSVAQLSHIQTLLTFIQRMNLIYLIFVQFNSFFVVTVMYETNGDTCNEARIHPRCDINVRHMRPGRKQCPKYSEIGRVCKQMYRFRLLKHKSVGNIMFLLLQSSSIFVIAQNDRDCDRADKIILIKAFCPSLYVVVCVSRIRLEHIELSVSSCDSVVLQACFVSLILDGFDAIQWKEQRPFCISRDNLRLQTTPDEVFYPKD